MEMQKKIWKSFLLNFKNKLSRKAKFRTIIALNITNKQYLFEGICDGEILNEKTGVKGFGYDPIFKPSNASCSFAEMNSEEKNIISHRGIAIQELVQFLNSL
jgi:XTP/dITP diphosphohydrolase